MHKTIITTLLSLALLAGTATPALAGTEATTQVRLKVGTATTQVVSTTATTVAGLLAERKVTLGSDDTVAPSLPTALAKGTKIVVTRIVVATRTVTEAVAFPVITKKNTSMRKGTSKTLIKGVPGSAKRTYTLTTTNGKVTKKVLVTQTVLVEPIAKVMEVGTKGKAINQAHKKMWERVAKCESGGRWHINTGNGYYGGLQFNLATWRSTGGRDFASKPHKASKAEQITVANRLYAKRGLKPWGGCGRKAR